MFKATLTATAAIAAQGVNASFHKDSPLATQVIQSMFEYDDYTANQSDAMKLTWLNQLPCTYWHNDSWYDLTNIGEIGSTKYWTSKANAIGNMVSFNFC